MSPPQGWGISAGSWFPGLTAFASFYRAYSAMKGSSERLNYSLRKVLTGTHNVAKKIAQKRCKRAARFSVSCMTTRLTVSAVKAGCRKGMNVFLPLALLVIACVGVGLQHSKPKGGWPSPASYMGLLALILLAGFAIHKFAPPSDFSPISLAAVIGLVTVLAATLIEQIDAPTASLIALGAVGPAALILGSTKPLDESLMAAPAAAALCALVLQSRSGFIAALVVALSCIAAAFGFHSDLSFSAPSAGVVLFGAAALVGLAGIAFERLVPKASKAWPVIACIALAAIAYAASIKYLMLGPGWVGVAIAPIVALLASWLTEASGENQTFPLLVTAALWLGLATAAFGLSKSFGVSLALVLSVATLAILNADKALLATGPMFAVVLTQLFRQLHPDAVRSVDVGQNYILIGLAAGALFPLLPLEWLQEKAGLSASRKAAGGFIWAVTLCAAPVLIGIYLAPKGLVGFAAGLGFAGLLAANRERPLLVISLSAGVGCLTLLEYGWMGDLTDMARPDKIHWLLYSALACGCVAAILAALTFQVRKPIAEPA
jgi:hypothetical protein